MSQNRLPWRALLALTLTVLLGCLSEVLPAGLLLGISEELRVSPSAAGQLVTVYAVTTAVTAIPLTALTSRLPRKRVLVALVLGFVVTNLAIATSPGYGVVLGARVISGAITGVMWSLVAVYAMRIAPPGQAGRALAIAMAGTPIGFAAGVPAGTALGELVGWRWSFAVMAAIAVPLLCWILLVVPAVTTEPARPARHALPMLRQILVMVFVYSLAHNMLYTYIGPVLTRLDQEYLLTTALLVFGVAAVGGILAVGSTVDRNPRGVLGWCPLLTAAGMVLLAVSDDWATTLMACAVWGLAFGGAPTAFQSVTALIAGRDADRAQSLTIAAWNGAVAGGAAVGGVVLDTAAPALAWTAAALVVVPFWIATRLPTAVGRGAPTAS
ncbi:MFS transporter [Lentzea flaviverrucosa]|uniref:Predicted arabinose efflux permease, MFS family n=1 Tax=Lentzea flaviverrucosa TaxID=200379 RepID=A0A1H9C230_9PSEU|nr:MFS transporter [Lentzea flaviverrucosa]RDI24429.1 putative MFS family arabinose efflux permease [Lentzea flaviverrucosa]SEP95174.1 Predicted arabinose efflux permease, MFS family [Lentzea flaviverrucosa]